MASYVVLQKERVWSPGPAQSKHYKLDWQVKPNFWMQPFPTQRFCSFRATQFDRGKKNWPNHYNKKTEQAQLRFFLFPPIFISSRIFFLRKSFFGANSKAIRSQWGIPGQAPDLTELIHPAAIPHFCPFRFVRTPASVNWNSVSPCNISSFKQCCAIANRFLVTHTLSLFTHDLEHRL